MNKHVDHNGNEMGFDPFSKESKTHVVGGGVTGSMYAQGEVSFKFKALVKEAVKNADSDTKLDDFLNVLHDAVLTARNKPDGLRAAVKFLESSKQG